MVEKVIVEFVALVRETYMLATKTIGYKKDESDRVARCVAYLGSIPEQAILKTR